MIAMQLRMTYDEIKKLTERLGSDAKFDDKKNVLELYLTVNYEMLYPIEIVEENNSDTMNNAIYDYLQNIINIERKILKTYEREVLNIDERH